MTEKSNHKTSSQTITCATFQQPLQLLYFMSFKLLPVKQIPYILARRPTLLILYPGRRGDGARSLKLLLRNVARLGQVDQVAPLFQWSRIAPTLLAHWFAQFYFLLQHWVGAAQPWGHRGNCRSWNEPLVSYPDGWCPLEWRCHPAPNTSSPGMIAQFLLLWEPSRMKLSRAITVFPQHVCCRLRAYQYSRSRTWLIPTGLWMWW